MKKVHRSASYAVLAVAAVVSLFVVYANAASQAEVTPASTEKLYYEDVSKFYIYVRPPVGGGFRANTPPSFQRDNLRIALRTAVENRMKDLITRYGGEMKPIEVLEDIDAIDENAFVIYLVVGAQESIPLDNAISDKAKEFIKSYHPDMSNYDVAHYTNTLNATVGYFSKGYTRFNQNMGTTAGTFEREERLFHLLSQAEPVSIFLGQPEEELKKQLEDYLKYEVWLPSPKLKVKK